MPSSLFPFTTKLGNNRVKILFIYSSSNRIDKNLIEKFESHRSTIAFKPDLDIFDLDLAEFNNQSEWTEYALDVSTIDIVVPLISAYFLKITQDTHKYYSLIRQIMQLHDQHVIEIVPVLLQPTYNWQTFFSDLEALPRNRAIKSSSDEGEAFVEVVQGLDEIISKIIENRHNLQTYYETFLAAIEQNYPLETDDLASLRSIREELSLRDEDAEKIELEVIQWKKEEIIRQRELEAYQRTIEQEYQDLPETDQSGIPFWVFPIILACVMGIIFIFQFNVNVDKYIQEGRDFYKNQEFEKAIEKYDRAIELQPNNFHHYNDRGNAYYFMGNYQAAIDDYTRAIDLNPENLHGYRYRGEARLKLGEYAEGATADLKKAAILYQKDGNLQDYQSTMDILQQIQQ